MSDLTSPFAGKPLSRTDAGHLAGIVKALAAPARLQLLGLLSLPSNVQELTEELGYLSEPTVSHHLATLHAAGLVHREVYGNFVTYSLNRRRIAEVAAALNPVGRRARGVAVEPDVRDEVIGEHERSSGT